MDKKEKLNNLFSNMIEKIEVQIQLVAFIIFGSRARGNALPSSDYDIVIIGDFEEKYLNRSKWIVHVAPEVPIDLFCYTPEEFETLFNQFNLTAIDAINDGIFLKGEAFLQKFIDKLKFFKKRGLRKEGHILIPPHL
ncbi:MAG: nucleotidyltransferase domain-containing protein [Candidatus Thorarchaeota archaeon]